ncbi:hypothetical protein FN846DRAFT_910744 [Sphaerosporella brunnea]|uniref:P-loop containing nucleoside triphosphate hydrolase protein n=1 Tax=Sphaerosporella brunnea TaxID=1250544 RepID=A0A5J5EMS6_9PEZI|nr:hypothetical protein FN846DRAFT_910744 [Sphaerosporella brunnea]
MLVPSLSQGMSIFSVPNEQAHHMYLCFQHMDYVMAAEYVTKGTGLLQCGCKQRLKIGASFTDWWKTLKLAKSSLARQSERAKHHGEEPRADVVEHGNDFADLPAEDELVGKEAEEQFRFRPRGSTETTYVATAVSKFDDVWAASELAPRMASLLADRDAKHPLVLFLRGQSGSGKTWLTRKLLEPLEGAQISITSIEGGAATRTIPRRDDKARTVELTKRLLDVVGKWSRTAKTAASQSSSRAVVAYRMDGLLLIDMPGGGEVGDRPQETRMINTTNMKVLATLNDFRNTGKAPSSYSRNPAVQFFSKPLRIHGVRVLVATVLRDTDFIHPKALRRHGARTDGPFNDSFTIVPVANFTTPGRLDVARALLELQNYGFLDSVKAKSLVVVAKTPCGTVMTGKIGCDPQGWWEDWALISLEDVFRGKNGLFWDLEGFGDISKGVQDIAAAGEVEGGVDLCHDRTWYKDGASSEWTAGEVSQQELELFLTRTALPVEDLNAVHKRNVLRARFFLLQR